MNNASSVNHYISEYDALASTLPGQSVPWLHELRQQSLSRFSQTGFPSLRDEEWRYTNVTGIEKKLFSPLTVANPVVLDRAWLESKKLKDVWSVVLIDGRYSEEFSNLFDLPVSVIIKSMSEAIEDDSEMLEKYLGSAVSSDEHNFIAFNMAWFADGVVIHLPENEKLAKPIQVLHVVTGRERLAATRNLYVAKTASEAQIIETFVGADESYLTNCVSEVFVEANADLKLLKVQCESEKAYHFGGTYVQQGRDARFQHHNFSFGGLLARTDVHSDLDIASECFLSGLYLGVRRQHQDNHTRINHLKPYAISREQYKGILDDRARGVFQGRVIVAEQAQRSDSEMNNRNLLLSEHAEVDTKPQLEIYADDVKCAHGVTVGQLDNKSIFYLQSRGIDEQTARNMLTFAFANEMVSKIEFSSLHEFVLQQLLQRFPQHSVEQAWL